MDERTVAVYSEQELTPRAAEVIRAILDSRFTDFTVALTEFMPYRDLKVLVFGKPPTYVPDGVELIYTYSIAQIMSKPNAASVLEAGIRQYLSEPEPMPFQEPVGTRSIADAFATMDPTKPTAIDIETDGLLGKTHTPEEINVISIAFYQEGAPPVVVHGDWFEGRTLKLAHTTELLLRQLLPKFEKAIYHNGKFDTRVLNRVLGIELNVWFDTMLAHHVLNHAAGDHKLKPAARRYCGAPDWEVGLTKYLKGGGHYELIPTDKLVEYNGYDVYWTYKLWQYLAPQIEADADNEKALLLESQAAEFLLDVEKYGIPMDMGYAKQYSQSLEKAQKVELQVLRRLLGDDRFNPGSWQQVKRAFQRYGVDVPNTTDDTLSELEDTIPENTNALLLAEHVLKYRKLGKTKGTYTDGWSSRARNGRVHPTYLVHGTSTGRLSSTGPNAQNVPRDKTIRKMVRTLDG